MLAIATLLLITASWVSFLVPVAIRKFDDTFRALGPDLPPITQLVISTPRLCQVFLVLAVGLFIWVLARSRVTREELRRMKLAMRLLIVLMLLGYGFAAWAIYAPLSRMGQVI